MDSAQMPRNGSGVFSLASGYEATTGQTATASQHNTPLEDIATDLNAARPIVAGGTGATTASAARTALGLAIGTDVQAYHANLASLSGLTFAANKGLYTTAANTAALFDLTAAGLALLDDADAAAQRTTLGLGGLATLDILDEDDMATDSATRPPSQQSTAAFVNARRTRETALTTSGAAEYGFTGITAGANRITVMFSAVSGAGTDDFLIQIGDSGGYETTGYSAASAYVSGSGNDVFSSTAGFPINTVNSASTVLSGAVVLTRIDGNTWVASGVLHDSNVPGTPTVTGTKTLSAELDRIRLKTSGSDNFDGGTLNIIVET